MAGTKVLSKLLLTGGYKIVHQNIIKNSFNKWFKTMIILTVLYNGSM